MAAGPEQPRPRLVGDRIGNWAALSAREAEPLRAALQPLASASIRPDRARSRPWRAKVPESTAARARAAANCRRHVLRRRDADACISGELVRRRQLWGSDACRRTHLEVHETAPGIWPLQFGRASGRCGAGRGRIDHRESAEPSYWPASRSDERVHRRPSFISTQSETAGEARKKLSRSSDGRASHRRSASPARR